MTLDKKKGFAVILSILFVISTFLLFFMVNYRLIVFDESFYWYEYQKLNISNNFPQQQIEGDVHLTYQFLQGNAELSTDFYTPDEKIHMEEVKHVISRFNFFFLILCMFEILALSLLFALKKKSVMVSIKKLLLYSSILVLIASFLFYLFSDTFTALFIKFHELFFQGNWMFASESNMIMAFPQMFFYDVFYRIISHSALMAYIVLMVIIATFIFQRIRKLKKEFQEELAEISRENEKKHSPDSEKAEK